MTKIQAAFSEAFALNGNVDHWDVLKVKNFYATFCPSVQL